MAYYQVDNNPNRKEKMMKIIRVLALCKVIIVVTFLFCARTSSATELFTQKFVAVSVEKNGSDYQVTNLRVANAKYVYSDTYEIYKGKNNGRIISFQGKDLGYFPVGSLKTILCSDEFDEKTGEISGGCEEVSQGNLLINIPYFPNGKFADIYNEKGEKVFSINLTSIATCNENTTCEQRESQENCPSDCSIKDTLSKFKVVESNPGSTATTESEKGNVWYLLTAVFVLISALVFYFIWRKKRK